MSGSTTSPPGWVFYGVFALVGLAILMGTTQLHDWGGTNLPDTGSELLGIGGWWAMALVVAPVWLGRFAWTAVRGALRPTGEWHPLLRWLTPPVVVVFLGVLTLTEVIPHVTGHFALTDPSHNRATVEHVMQGAILSSGFAAKQRRSAWSSEVCDSYPSRRADLVEIELEGLTKAEADLALQRLQKYWIRVAADRGWTAYGASLVGGHFYFSTDWAYDEQRSRVLLLTGETPCTIRQGA